MQTSGTSAAAQPAIEDFGEYIPGARKELAAERLAIGMASDPEFRKTLTGSWPTPPWRKLAERHAAEGQAAEILACVRGIRDELRTDAGRRYERDAARRQLPGLREAGRALLAGEASVEETLDAVTRRNRYRGRACRVRMGLYLGLGHANDLMHYHVSEDVRNQRWLVRAPRFGGWGTGVTTEAAARNLGEKLAARGAPEKRTPRCPYEVRYVTDDNGRRSYSIWRRANSRRIRIRSVRNVREGLETIRDRRAELDTWWERWRRIPDIRHASNEPRTGPAAGTAGDPDAFTARYGFRGVQFGNWVEKARRERDLTEASEGLEDLAAALGWPVGALSLGGSLALAFGARGKGGRPRVRAHYEPARRVIAISKPLGAGSLAHEWLHALDHHVGRATNAPTGYATTEAGFGVTGPLEGLAETLAQFGRELSLAPLARRSAKLDLRRSTANAYWSTTIEMAARTFEAWVAARLAAQGIRNDYLVNYVRPDEWPADPKKLHPYPYPYEDELAAIGPVLEGMAENGRTAAERWAADTASREGGVVQ